MFQLANMQKLFHLPSGTGSRIAIIYAEGEIVDGKGDKGQILRMNIETLLEK